MLLISDANIFIDLEKTDLLKHFDKLGIAIATSDFVYDELNPKQRTIVTELNVEIYAMESGELMDFYLEFAAQRLNKISPQDYSIFYYAKKHDGEVLSNDKRLRKYAQQREIPIKGLFFILDTMIEQHCITPRTMVEKLLQLKEINKRLPIDEIDKRIKLWMPK